MPGRVAQSVGHLTRKSGVLGSIPGLATYFRFSFPFSRRAVVSYWRRYVHKVLVNRLGGLSLPRKSVVRLTDRPDMTLDVYRGRKTTIQLFIQDILVIEKLLNYTRYTDCWRVTEITRGKLIVEESVKKYFEVYRLLKSDRITRFLPTVEG